MKIHLERNQMYILFLNPTEPNRTEPKLWFSKMNLDSYCYARTNSLYVKILHYAYTIVSSCLEFWFVTTNLVFFATQNGLDPCFTSRAVPTVWCCRRWGPRSLVYNGNDGAVKNIFFSRSLV